MSDSGEKATNNKRKATTDERFHEADEKFRVLDDRFLTLLRAAVLTGIFVVGILVILFCVMGWGLDDEARLRDLEEAVAWLYCNDPVHVKVDCTTWSETIPRLGYGHFLKNARPSLRGFDHKFGRNGKGDPGYNLQHFGDKGDVPGQERPCVPNPQYLCPGGPVGDQKKEEL